MLESTKLNSRKSNITEDGSDSIFNSIVVQRIEWYFFSYRWNCKFFINPFTNSLQANLFGKKRDVEHDPLRRPAFKMSDSIPYVLRGKPSYC